jgi:hypothetical protein
MKKRKKKHWDKGIIENNKKKAKKRKRFPEKLRQRELMKTKRKKKGNKRKH